MFQLIQTQINNETVQTVDARQLHGFLGVGRDFTNWIKNRIAEYGFEEGVDYMAFFAKFGENSEKGRPSKEYAIKIDMAKELCMLERNEKGRHARHK